MLPGDHSIEDEDRTDRESIMTIFALDSCMVANIESKSDSVKIEIFLFLTPRRTARALI